ncbi:MAG: zinc ribbon domain-containing protein [Actinobacteria bacterium]|nr:zinc ribbon domain-containing protein [Actinomycetota bacterium]
MGEYAFYRFEDQALQAYGAELLPVPVRREVEREVFGGEEVLVDLLLEELLVFLEEYPDFQDLYAGTIETLTWMAGMKAGMEGNMEDSSHYLEIGLGANPDSLPLRSSYALVLQLQGRKEDALEQYEVVLEDPEGTGNPLVCLLAARLYAEQGEYLEAYRLLDAVAASQPADDAFWDFLAEMKELAGIEEEEPEAGKLAEGQAPTARLFCVGCGKELMEGASFCSACGRHAGRPAGRPPVVCAACGSELEEGVRFCRACGKPVQGEAEPLVFCPGCGNRLGSGERFCRRCGRKIY